MAKFAAKMRNINRIANYRLTHPDTSDWPKEITKSIKSIKKDVLKDFEFYAKSGGVIWNVERTIESTVVIDYLPDDVSVYLEKIANEIFGPYGIRVTVKSCYARTIKLLFELE